MNEEEGQAEGRPYEPSVATERALMNELLDAIDPFLADQSRATDSRCGLVQPVTVADCETLNTVVKRARKFLEIGETNEELRDRWCLAQKELKELQERSQQLIEDIHSIRNELLRRNPSG